MSLTIRFCGAAGTVTGSCYWVRTDNTQFLVDCGMFQGTKTVKELNYGAFPFNPKDIDFVLLTHAHIDHAGLLPKLTKLGFEGAVYTTRGTRDLLAFMLPDSAYIQETEVSRLNLRNRQRGRPTVEPMYRMDDVELCLTQIHSVRYETWLEIGDIRARFWNAGHILGAASIEIEVTAANPETDTTRFLFSGDIGPDHKLFHPDPEAPSDFDYLVCESTYGGRKRTDASPDNRRALLSREINDAMKRGGALIIPTFAVERTQELLLDIAHLLRHGEIPKVPVFLDSPLAIKVTSVFSDHAASLEDIQQSHSPFDHPSFHFTESVEESKSIARFSGNAIILSASGMCDAGRIRHHLKNNLWRQQSTVLLVGFQAEGTLGRLLLDGKKKVKIQGEEIDVKAQIRSLDVYSGHGDHDDILEWINERLPIRKTLFLTHGDREALLAMQQALIEGGMPNSQIVVPDLDDEFDLVAADNRLHRTKIIKRLDQSSVTGSDWHNDLAQLTIDLRATIEAAKTDEERRSILAQISKLIPRKSTH